MPTNDKIAMLAATVDPLLSAAHPSWHDVLRAGLAQVMQSDANYLPQLLSDHYLPLNQRLFAAFSQPLPKVQYVLIGEGPYPRAESATGFCFMDGAVKTIWAPDQSGFAKTVNRATSLRNFLKMLLVAEGLLKSNATGGNAIAPIAAAAHANPSAWIQTLSQLQQNLTSHGFLLLNASLVYRDQVAPARDAKAWQPFMQTIFAGLAQRQQPLPCLILWGKIAAQLESLLVAVPNAAAFPRAISEHPYNLSFITNQTMQQLFFPMRLLHPQAA